MADWLQLTVLPCCSAGKRLVMFDGRTPTPCRVRRCRPDMQLGSAIIKYLSRLPPRTRYIRGHHGAELQGCGGVERPDVWVWRSKCESLKATAATESIPHVWPEKERDKVPRPQVPLTSPFARSVNATWCEKKMQWPQLLAPRS